MFTIKSCFTIPEPVACHPAGPVGLLPDVRRRGGNVVLFRRTGGEREGEMVVGRIGGILPSACPDKGPLQTRSRQGCHLLANMLSVIFCALGSPGGAGPHGSPAHANRTNPSRTCLSVSLSPSLSSSVFSSFSPHPFPFSTFARQCVRPPRLPALSSISLFVHSFPLLSLPLSLRPRRHCCVVFVCVCSLTAPFEFLSPRRRAAARDAPLRR